MNKKWPKLKREDLINTKIHIKSEEQLKAFIAACKYCGFSKALDSTEFSYAMGMNYRYMYENCMTWGKDVGEYARHENKEIFFEPIEDEDVEYPNPPHKHRDLIIAWANGADIECYNGEGWVLCDPRWLGTGEYRVKPSEIERIEIEMRGLSEKQKELADKLSKLKG